MGKKKSKTQKYKRNQKRKQQKIIQQKTITKIEPKSNESAQKDIPVKQKDIPKLKKDKKQIQLKRILNNIKEKTIQINKQISYLITKLKNKLIKQRPPKEPEIVLPKLKKSYREKIIKEKNTSKIYRFFSFIKNNLHIFFNAVIISTYIIMIIGLIRIEMYEASTIIYIGCIVLFLMIVAISYNKYLSGKVFTTLIVIGMGLAIYKMQYTYDFIRNLNSSEYEYKTYYVITFDNGLNKSIYNINNKKVGLLKENCTNIERKLNTKLNKVTYLEYLDLNKLFTDFYSQQFRALIVNENQYKFLENNIINSRKVKILYEFQANAKK